MSSIKIILRSGKEFTIKCKSFSAKKNGFGVLTGYEISGIEENRPLYINIPKIDAIVQVLSDETEECK